MKLQGIYTDLRLSMPVLYQLMEEREPHQNISHKRMPTWREHEDHVYSIPHDAWYLILDDVGQPGGAVYVTKRHEIGIGILKSHRRRGLARAAIQEVMRLHHDRPLLANINPDNADSLAFFRSLGFTGPIQVTMAWEGA